METPDFAQTVQDKQKAARAEHVDTVKHKSLISSQDAIQQAVIESAKANIQHRAQHEPNVVVTNPVVIDNLDEVTRAVGGVKQAVDDKSIDLAPILAALKGLTTAVNSLPKDNPEISFPEIPEPKEDVTVTNLAELDTHFANLEAAVRSLKLDPQIKVAAPKVEVKSDPVDLSPLLESLASMRGAIEGLVAKPEPVLDLTPVMIAAGETTSAIQALRFPVPNFVQDPFARYKVADVDDASAVKYYGYIAPEGTWYIMKEDTSVSPKTYRYTAGSGNGTTSNQYPAQWALRVSQTYDYLSIALP